MGRQRGEAVVVGCSAGCVHLNLHLPTAKTNKRLIGQGAEEEASTVAAQTATNYVT